MRLQNKIAAITGAGSGIGRATVERFVAEGAHVVIGDIDAVAGKELASQLGDQVRFVQTDVTRESDIEEFIKQTVTEFGGIDILINNAGAGGMTMRIDDFEAAAWDKTQALLVRAAAIATRAAVPHLKARGGGVILNTSSVAAFQAGAGPIAYSVAKAAVLHLTRVAAAELAQYAIRVNAICPGLILTNIFTPADQVSPEVAAEIRQYITEVAPKSQPLARAGLPEDVANAMLFLASDEASFVTGTHLVIDGGMLVGPRESWDPDAAGAFG